MLYSLNTVTKKTTIAAMILGWATPDPGFGPPIELRGGNTGSLFDFLGIRETLTSEGIATEEAPPALLQVEPTGSGRNEDVVQTRVRFHPGPRLQAVVAGEIIRDEVEVACRIVGLDIGEQCDVTLGVT